MVLRARAKTACEIARIDPNRFNEMVHAGYYPCAPETRPGSARIFEVDEIVTLRIFGKLLALTIAPERAGKIACAAYSEFVNRGDAKSVVYMVQRNGDWRMVRRSFQDDDSLPEFYLSFSIPDMRKEVTDHLERLMANQVVGED